MLWLPLAGGKEHMFNRLDLPLVKEPKRNWKNNMPAARANFRTLRAPMPQRFASGTACAAFLFPWPPCLIVSKRSGIHGLSWADRIIIPFPLVQNRRVTWAITTELYCPQHLVLPLQLRSRWKNFNYFCMRSLFVIIPQTLKSRKPTPTIIGNDC